MSATGTGLKRTIPAIERCESLEVSAIHGRNSRRLQAAADIHRIPSYYTELTNMIDSHEFDFAIICSPPFLHVDQTLELIKAGIPCLVEKPLCLSAADVDRIAVVAEQATALVRVAHHLRFAPVYRAVRNLLEGSALGSIHRASMEWSFRLDVNRPSAKWKLNPLLNGPTALTDAGSHCLDAAVNLFGRGRVEHVVTEERSREGTFEEVTVVADHDGVSVVTTASRRYGPYSNDLRVTGDEGEVTIPGFFNDRPGSDMVTCLGGEWKREHFASGDPYRSEIEDFAGAVGGERTSIGATLADAREAALLADAVSDQIL